MPTDAQVLYHVSNQEFAIDFFNRKTTIDWKGDEFNQNTLQLNTYQPGVEVAGHHIDIIRALSSFGTDLLEISERSKLIKHLTEALRFTNRRYVEHLIESIRQQHFSHLPSRANCVYLTNEENLRYWYYLLKDNNTVIFKFYCQGTFHTADASWISDRVIPTEDYVEQALNYWQGLPHPDHPKPTTEILFSGKLTKLNSYHQPREALTAEPELRKTLDFFRELLTPVYFSKESVDHGLLHTCRVMLNALKIAFELKLGYHEKVKVLCAAFLHDLSRSHEGPCEIHGQLAVIQKLPFFLPSWVNLGIDHEGIEEVKMAVIHHCKKDNSTAEIPNKSLLQILKDADALDRMRYGKDALNLRYLRLKATQSQLPWAEELISKSTASNNPPVFFAQIAKSILREYRQT